MTRDRRRKLADDFVEYINSLPYKDRMNAVRSTGLSSGAFWRWENVSDSVPRKSSAEKIAKFLFHEGVYQIEDLKEPEPVNMERQENVFVFSAVAIISLIIAVLVTEVIFFL